MTPLEQIERKGHRLKKGTQDLVCSKCKAEFSVVIRRVDDNGRLVRREVVEQAGRPEYDLLPCGYREEGSRPATLVVEAEETTA